VTLVVPADPSNVWFVVCQAEVDKKTRPSRTTPKQANYGSQWELCVPSRTTPTQANYGSQWELCVDSKQVIAEGNTQGKKIATTQQGNVRCRRLSTNCVRRRGHPTVGNRSLELLLMSELLFFFSFHFHFSILGFY
jgi:hypothetical protein